MFKRLTMLALLAGILFSSPSVCRAQEEDPDKGVLVIREAQEFGDNNVAVIGYLKGNIFEVKVVAGMFRTKPEIDNCIVVGPKLGRLSASQKETIYPKAEDEVEDDVFMTDDVDGAFLLRFSKQRKKRQIKGALTRELYRYKIPKDKIIKGKKYELRVKIESTQNPGIGERFTFKLENFPELIHGEEG